MKEMTKQFRRFTRAAQARKTEDRWVELERASGELRRDIRRIREIEDGEDEGEEVTKERWQEANRRQQQIERERWMRWNKLRKNTAAQKRNRK